MSFVVQSIYHALTQVPGLAARTHLPCGRMGRRLRSIVALAGILFMAGGAMCGIGAYRGFSAGDFGYFPAIIIGLVAAFLLAGGIHAVVRAVKNPAPRTAPNVIPIRRPVEYEARDLHRYRRWEE